MHQTFGYARVSTSEQNLDTQLDILTHAGCDRIFQDRITGMSLQRPALDELLGLLREGDTVLVARFFRLGRSRDHVIHLVNLFHQRGIHFKALDLGIDTTTPAGKFMLSIFASLAEYDRESIIERTKAGQQLAASQGKHIGRPKGADAENLRKVRKALERGLSVAEIVELTNISLSTVKRYRKYLLASTNHLPSNNTNLE